MLNEKKEFKKAMYEVANDNLPTLNTELTYQKELFTKRYILNASMPLNFGSSKSQAKKTAALKELSAINYEIESFKQKHQKETNALKRHLEIYNKYVKQTEKSIKQASNKLVKQSKLRFSAGEDSFVELLKATETKLGMIDNIFALKLKRHSAVFSYLNRYAIDPKGVIK